jgi:hypothetical protein
MQACLCCGTHVCLNMHGSTHASMNQTICPHVHVHVHVVACVLAWPCMQQYFASDPMCLCMCAHIHSWMHLSSMHWHMKPCLHICIMRSYEPSLGTHGLHAMWICGCITMLCNVMNVTTYHYTVVQHAPCLMSTSVLRLMFPPFVCQTWVAWASQPLSVPCPCPTDCHAHFVLAYNCNCYSMGMWRSKAPGCVLALP